MAKVVEVQLIAKTDDAVAGVNKVEKAVEKTARSAKKTSKEFEVLSGPYKSINLLKNDYIVLKNFGFEELDIFINE